MSATVAQKALEANDSDADAHYVLAWLLVDQGGRDEATAHFQKALSLGLSSKDAELAVGALRRLGAAVPAGPLEGQGPPARAHGGTGEVQQPPPAPAAPAQAVRLR